MSDNSKLIELVVCLDRYPTNHRAAYHKVDFIWTLLNYGETTIEREELFDLCEEGFKRGWLDALVNSGDSGHYRISASGQMMVLKLKSSKSPTPIGVVAPIRSPALLQPTAETVSAVVVKLKSALDTIDKLSLSNSEKSQAKAYVSASLAIAEAPTPRWDLIKEILMVASAIAGVGSLIAAILVML